MSGKVPKKKPRPGVDFYGRQPLHYAAAEGDLEAVKSLLSAGANPSFADDNGCTPLHFAASRRQVAVVALLLDQGANPNAVDAHGNNPLWTALMSAHDEPRCVELLLRAGADREKKNAAGRSPLDMALTFGQGWEVVFARKSD